MDAHSAAEEMAKIVDRLIEQEGSARYKQVVEDFSREFGDQWIVVNESGRENFDKAVMTAFRKLPTWPKLEFSSGRGRQRWTRKESGK